MIKLFLLLSHELEKDQYAEIKERFGVSEILKLPDNLKYIWSNIPPEGEFDKAYINGIEEFLLSNAAEKNYVLVQGEFGAVYIIVNWCFKNNFIPIYSTTSRVYEKKVLNDGRIENTHIFKHVNFRHYVKFE